MDLSIVIVNWNTRALLADCLRSVFDSAKAVDFEVLVVDNASADSSAAMIGELFPAVRLIENQENVGFARANNQAIHHATGRYVLLLNSDTEVYPGALSALVSYLDTHPRVGAAGPRLLNSDGSLQISCCPMPTLLRECWRLFHLDRLVPLAIYPMNVWDVGLPRRVDTVQGACLLLRGTALEQVGLLDDMYFMYSEEIDLCHRLARAGWSIYWVPEARVLHYGGQSSRQASTEMFLQLYRSKLLFFRKTRGPIGSLIYKLILMVAAVARLVLSPLAYLLSRSGRRQIVVKAGLYCRLIARLHRL